MSIFKVQVGMDFVNDEHTTLEYAEIACARLRPNTDQKVVIHWFDTQQNRRGHYLVGTFMFEDGNGRATKFVRF
jgi:hypothetical protein